MSSSRDLVENLCLITILEPCRRLLIKKTAPNLGVTGARELQAVAKTYKVRAKMAQ